MSSEPSPNERTQVVLLAAVVALSLVAGAGVIAGQTAAQSDSDTNTGEASATPGSVGVTAGAANQTPIAEDGGGSAALNFTEDALGGFPANGTATLSLPSDGDVSFDTANSSVSVVAQGATVGNVTLRERTVEIEVESTDNGTNSVLSVSGLRFVTGGNASVVEATWSFGNAEGVTRVEPERLETTGFGDVLERGAHDVPDDGTGFVIDAPDDARTEGFHAEDEFISVTVPEAHAGRLSFNESVLDDIVVEADGGDCGGFLDIGISLGGNPETQADDDMLLIDPGCEIGSDEYVTVENLRFDVAGAEAGDAVDVDVDLNVESTPVGAAENATVAGENDLRLRGPTVDVGTTTIETNETATAGDVPLKINVADEHGSMIGAGTQVTVEVNGTGVTFNESQTFEAVSVAGDTAPPTVVNATATSITLEVGSETAAGDEFRVQREGGNGILFDVAEGAGNASFDVTTTPGGEDVTQVTDGGVVTTKCVSILEAVDENDDGNISDFELLDAAGLWRQNEPVPGTCGELISDFDLLDIAEKWRNDQQSEGQA
jgi:hypothetical protein